MKSRFRKRGGGHGSVGARGGGQGGGEGVHRTVTQWRPIATRTLFRKKERDRDEARNFRAVNFANFSSPPKTRRFEKRDISNFFSGRLET